MSWVHWGDVPGWVSAVSTAGAFATGGWLLKRELDEGTRRQRTEALAEEDRRRAQASSVAAWPDRLKYPLKADGSFASEFRAVVQVHNASRLPVYDASLIFSGEDESVRAQSIGVVAPGRETHELDAPYLDRHVLTLGGWRRYEPGATGFAASEGPASDPFRFSVAITFRDASGVWWTRDKWGLLTEGCRPLPPSEPVATPVPSEGAESAS